ncbi:MAG: hypothetical protein Q9168_007224 [Polycauliona sp. 1 TL-2023]
MFDLVFQHQRPRIKYYIAQLRQALQHPGPPRSDQPRMTSGLTESLIKALPTSTARLWIDDHGLEYRIPVSSVPDLEGISKATLTDGTLKEMDQDSAELVNIIQKLCIETRNTGQKAEEESIKHLLRGTHDAWQGMKSRSTIKAHLQIHFGSSVKRLSKIMNLLLYLSRIYKCAKTFVAAAEQIHAFKSIEISPVAYELPISSGLRIKATLTPLEAAKQLRLSIEQASWIRVLEKGTERFEKLLEVKRRKRHIHAEAQILHHHSKLANTQFLPERKGSRPEKSTRDIPRLMTMAIVANDRPLISNMIGKPGYARVFGAGLPIGEEMTVGDAECPRWKTLFREFASVAELRQNFAAPDAEPIIALCHANANIGRSMYLARSPATLSQIAQAFQDDSLAALMKSNGIDLSMLESQGIYPRAPPPEDIGIYRFMAEIKHALSCSYCLCSTSKCPQHSKYESILDNESESNYGFHGANTWERWQLLNFYGYVFNQPAFDPRDMQAAERDRDRNALESYVDGLVTDFRRKMSNLFLADPMFPKLRAEFQIRSGRYVCDCVFHGVGVPEGLDQGTPSRISTIREKFGKGSK